MNTPAHSWTCAGCARRVPLRVEVCHCGATREEARLRAAAARPGRSAGGEAPAGWRSLPGDVQALVLAAALSLTVGLGWLVYSPPRPEPLPALLGYADVPPPPPATPAARRPPFRMPWWK